MPRTSNLFITSQRAGSPPPGEIRCLDFNRDTPAWTSSRSGQLQTRGETWQASDNKPSLLLFSQPCFSHGTHYLTSSKCQFSCIKISDWSSSKCPFTPYPCVAPVPLSKTPHGGTWKRKQTEKCLNTLPGDHSNP